MNRTPTRIWFAITGLIIAVAWTGQSHGQPDEALRNASAAPSGGDCCVAMVDFVRIFNECDQIKDLNEILRKQEVDIQSEAKQRQKVIEDKQIELSAFQPGTPDFQLRRKDLIRLGTEANVWLKVAEQDMENQKFDWTKVVYKNAVQVVGQLSNERGYKMVLQYKEFVPDDTDQSLQTIRRMIQDRAVVHAEKDTDITDEVIRRLNGLYRAAGGRKQLEPSSSSNAPVRP